MKIGELARRAGISTSKVRFYEEHGLLPAATRLENGYRDYGSTDLERLTRVKRAQMLGFSLGQIARFMNLPESERKAKTGVLEAAEAKLDELDAHLADVQERRRQIVLFLSKLRAELSGESQTQ